MKFDSYLDDSKFTTVLGGVYTQYLTHILPDDDDPVKNEKSSSFVILTLQRGVTSTARHSVNITCRGVTSPGRHAARSHSFVYISTS